VNSGSIVISKISESDSTVSYSRFLKFLSSELPVSIGASDTSIALVTFFDFVEV
jgi:hypothetical protein